MPRVAKSRKKKSKKYMENWSEMHAGGTHLRKGLIGGEARMEQASKRHQKAITQR